MHENPTSSTETSHDSRDQGDVSVDGGLVDRTQQLIDEMNEVLGSGSISSDQDDSSRVGTSKELENLEDSVSTLKKFLKELSDKSEDGDAEESDISNAEASIQDTTEDEIETESSPDLETIKSAVAAKDDETACPDDPKQVEDVAAEENCSNIEKECSEEEVAEDDSVFEDGSVEDITEKYLREIREAFSDQDESNAEPVAEDKQPEEDDESIDVQDVLTENNAESKTVEAPVESTRLPTELEATETDSEENESSGEEQVECALSDELSTPENVNEPPVIVDHFDPAQTQVAAPFIATNENRIESLEALFSEKLSGLEERIANMLSTISGQIEQLTQVRVSVNAEADITEQSQSNDMEDVNAGGESESTGTAEHEPAEPVQEVDDSQMIEALKEQLTSKLREAEIELSINRAKLSQQKAEIEQMQAELERRETAVEAKLEQIKKVAGSNEKKRGLMDRWTRHLGE